MIKSHFPLAHPKLHV